MLTATEPTHDDNGLTTDKKNNGRIYSLEPSVPDDDSKWTDNDLRRLIFSLEMSPRSCVWLGIFKQTFTDDEYVKYREAHNTTRWSMSVYHLTNHHTATKSVPVVVEQQKKLWMISQRFESNLVWIYVKVKGLLLIVEWNTLTIYPTSWINYIINWHWEEDTNNHKTGF